MGADQGAGQGFYVEIMTHYTAKPKEKGLADISQDYFSKFWDFRIWSACILNLSKHSFIEIKHKLKLRRDMFPLRASSVYNKIFG